MPKISVIVPVYNVEKYIRRCVDSILGQTFTDFELILVDDGSPDHCPAICDEYAAKDSRVKVIHKENGGVSAARNAGLDAAQGDYIAFCDSDDYMSVDHLEQLAKKAITENADCVVAQYVTVDESEKEIRRSSLLTGAEVLSTSQDRWNYLIHDIMEGKHGWEVWTRLFRAEIIRENNIWFCTTCGNYAEDLGFTMEFALYSFKLCVINHYGYYYRIRTGSMMRNSQSMTKVPQLNEVSSYFGKKFLAAFEGTEVFRLYPVLHFLIMQTEFRKMVGNTLYPTVAHEIQKIEDKQWFYKNVKGIFKCKHYLFSYYGKYRGQQILLFSHYCLHGNWKRFRYESAIAYRLFIKGE